MRIKRTSVLLAHLLILPLTGVAQERYVVPRTMDGQPDLQGIWQSLNTAVWNIQDHSSSWGVPAGQGVVVGNEIPYQSWAQEQREENFENRMTEDSEANCKMVGVPRMPTRFATSMWRSIDVWQDFFSMARPALASVMACCGSSAHQTETSVWKVGDCGPERG